MLGGISIFAWDGITTADVRLSTGHGGWCQSIDRSVYNLGILGLSRAMKFISLVLFGLVSTLASANDAIIPVPRADGWWKELHERNLRRAEQAGAHQIRVAFYGDSITQQWEFENQGLPVWKSEMATIPAENFGIGGDLTQYLLWRLQNGELEGFYPEKVVVLIGTNNLQYNPNPEIIEGIAAVLHEIQLRQPQAQLYVMSLTPRGDARDPLHLRIAQVNLLLRDRLIASFPSVTYVDFYSRLVTREGLCNRQFILDDLLHFSTAGYREEAKLLAQYGIKKP